jgi:hypothetical protein
MRKHAHGKRDDIKHGAGPVNLAPFGQIHDPQSSNPELPPQAAYFALAHGFLFGYGIGLSQEYGVKNYVSTL